MRLPELDAEMAKAEATYASGDLVWSPDAMLQEVAGVDYRASISSRDACDERIPLRFRFVPKLSGPSPAMTSIGPLLLLTHGPLVSYSNS
jgi:hypothetical protein